MLVSSQPSFSRLGIVQTLRDLPSAPGLSKTFFNQRHWVMYKGIYVMPSFSQ